MERLRMEKVAMFTCGVCHGDDGREEMVEEAFRLDGR